MYKVKVYIHSESVHHDEIVNVEIELPSIPRVGEYLYLTAELIAELENKAKSDLVVAIKYAPDWFFGRSHNWRIPKIGNLKDLSFGDAICVVDVSYYAGDDRVYIELNK